MGDINDCILMLVMCVIMSSRNELQEVKDAIVRKEAALEATDRKIEEAEEELKQVEVLRLL